MIPSDSQTIGIIPTLLVGNNSFDANSIPFCTLCVELSESYIRFCIVQEENMECIWLEDYKFETVKSTVEVFERVQKIISTHLLWSSTLWKRVRVSYNTNTFCLVPALIFDANSASNYIQFSTGADVNKSVTILYHEIPVVNAYNIYAVPTAWHSWILTHYASTDIEFYHLSSALVIGSLVSHAEYNEVRMMSIYVEKGYFTLTITVSGQLLFCNRIKYQNPDELIYMILFILAELDIEPPKIHALCYGEIDLGSDIYLLLSQFLEQIEIGVAPTTLKYSQQCKEIGGHHYFALFNTYLISS